MREFLKSTVGRKYIMGISGLIWAGFVFGHMAGNMLIFVSHDAYNAYGHALTSGYFIYIVEAVLLLALLAHVICGVSLVIRNRASRPSRYQVPLKTEKGPSWTSRTMAIQGSVVLVFIILHLVAFKYGKHYETTVNGVVMRDLARLMVENFKETGFVAWYVVALVILGFHLRHGVTSIFQSFGLSGTYENKTVSTIGWIYAIVVAGGFLSQPIYVYLFA